MRKTLLVLAVALKYVLFTPLACGAPKVIAVPFTSTPSGHSDGKNEGLLGEDVLRKLASVTIDYAHKQVVFTEK